MDHMYALRIKKTSESDPDSYEATAAGFTAHLVLWRPWLTALYKIFSAEEGMYPVLHFRDQTHANVQ